jgi:hypothetical protein
MRLRSNLREFGWGAAGGACGALPILWIGHNLWDATTAGWAQAVGTIAAFGAVIWQTGAAERLRNVERREVAYFAAEAIRNSYQALLPVLKWADGTAPFINDFEKLQFHFGAREDDAIVRLLEFPLST